MEAGWTFPETILCAALYNNRIFCSVSWILIMLMELNYITVNQSELKLFFTLYVFENDAFS